MFLGFHPPLVVYSHHLIPTTLPLARGHAADSKRILASPPRTCRVKSTDFSQQSHGGFSCAHFRPCTLNPQVRRFRARASPGSARTTRSACRRQPQGAPRTPPPVLPTQWDLQIGAFVFVVLSQKFSAQGHRINRHPPPYRRPVPRVLGKS